MAKAAFGGEFSGQRPSFHQTPTPGHQNCSNGRHCFQALFQVSIGKKKCDGSLMFFA